MKLKDKQYTDFINALRQVITAERLIFDPARRLAYGTDASFYRLIPEVVIKTSEEQQVVAIIKAAEKYRIPITFRAAGTSLSGQAITNSVLITLDYHWNQFKVHEAGDRISLQPGVIGARANQILAPLKRKIGPDPASINSAKIGGIAANNASGMCCGTAQNSYQTLDSIRLVLADGTLLDTGDKKSREEFRLSHADLLSDLEKQRQEIIADQELTDLIRRKYKIKNTTGYSLNAFVDFEDPIDILQHLMIGSEGTLSFISEITYNTVPEYDDKASALIIFDNINIACKAVQKLKKAPIVAAELMDSASLASIKDPSVLGVDDKDLSAGTTAILIETRAESSELLAEQIKTLSDILAEIPMVAPLEFRSDPQEIAKLWNIRKGLFPAVGAVREAGTTVIIEDVAFPIEHLSEATLELQHLLKKYHYENAIIFGHALEGNLHFVFTQDFSDDKEVKRYQMLMDDVCHMVVHEYQGSLKAEHGTGRNMAPFVEMEWGAKAYSMMQRIKKSFDPYGILNPDVILSADPEIHLKNLKPLPQANPIVDRCIECGFCEVNCPSKDLTITPRQRIVLWREISRLKEKRDDPIRLKAFVDTFKYDGDATCATDGLCATSCPVDINTGNLIKEIRENNHSEKEKKQALWVSKKFKSTTWAVEKTLGIASNVHSLLGTAAMTGITSSISKLSGNRVPKWSSSLPTAAKFRSENTKHLKFEDKVVYFPSCLARTMGPAKGSPKSKNLPSTVISLLNRAKYEVILPDKLEELCCGKAFESKGFKDAAEQKQKELEKVLLRISNGGEYPILCETSPCLYHMKETLSDKLSLFEPLEFSSKFLLNRLKIKIQTEPISIHLTCSAQKMELTSHLIKVAKSCAKDVIIPEKVGCCGFAGDKGFLVPELNQSALKELKSEIPDDCNEGYSTSCTCEIGLSEHGKIPYRSVFYLLDKVTSGI
ncbi:MAG: FAD-binding oxidoreductase [Proteobacteria bacterium]|nr:FAD-binding oxidoreductase [Pseudomonadota bacterium]